jgi:hypothetical protein
MTAARKIEIIDGKLNQTFIGETEKFKVTSDEFEFVYQNGALKFKRDGDKLIVDRGELWDSEIKEFSVPVSGTLEITALFDAGSIELAINGAMATCLLQVGSEKPVLRSK